MLFKIIRFQAAILFLTALAPLSAQEFRMNSIPSGADVFLIHGGERENLGQAPLKMSLDDLRSKTGGGETFNFSVGKKGFSDEAIFLSNVGRNDIDVEVELVPKFSHHNPQEIDKLISELFEVQGLVRSKNYKDAIRHLSEVEKNHKDFSVVYEMKAGAYYMDKELQKSLSYYRKAFDINSENTEAFRMKKYLERLLGAQL